MGKNKPMPHNTLRPCETLPDIAQAASATTRDGKIKKANSGEPSGACRMAARQFETERLKIEGNCMPAIEGFAAGRRRTPRRAVSKGSGRKIRFRITKVHLNLLEKRIRRL